MFRRKRQMPRPLIFALAAGMASCGGQSGNVSLEHSKSAVWCPAAVTLSNYHRPHGDFDARSVIGLRLNHAKELAVQHGCVVRVTSVDGRPQFTTANARRDSIDVQVSRGIVSRFDHDFGPIG